MCVLVDAFSLSSRSSAKVLESAKDSLFGWFWNSISTFQHVGWLCFCFVCVRDKFLRNIFALMFCYSLFVFLCLTFQPFGWFCLCNFDFVEWKYLLFSLHFDCNVLFSFLRYVYLVCFLVILLWKHFAFSREYWTLINGWKWRRWKLWYASCCFSCYFPCVFVFYWII